MFSIERGIVHLERPEGSPKRRWDLWVHLAKHMSIILDIVVAEERIPRSLVDTELHNQAKDFFKILTDYIKGQAPEYYAVHAQQHLLSSQIIGSVISPRLTMPQINKILLDCSMFVDRLRIVRKLDKEGVHRAEILRDFFRELYERTNLSK